MLVHGVERAQYGPRNASEQQTHINPGEQVRCGEVVETGTMITYFQTRTSRLWANGSSILTILLSISLFTIQFFCLSLIQHEAEGDDAPGFFAGIRRA